MSHIRKEVGNFGLTQRERDEWVRKEAMRVLELRYEQRLTQKVLEKYNKQRPPLQLFVW